MISKIFLLLDVGPVGTGIGLFAAVAFFLVCAVVAFAAFLLLKKTLKMAFRVNPGRTQIFDFLKRVPKSYTPTFAMNEESRRQFLWGRRNPAILGAQSGIPTKKVIRGKGIVFWGTPARPIRDYLKELAVLARLARTKKS